MTYRLHRRQEVGGTLPEVFAFFRSPRNLEGITPPWLRFRIVDTTDDDVRAGTRIRYRLRVHGVPFTWESVIADYAENAYFADRQVSGPYRRWFHHHVFRSVSGGVAIEDIVDYQLPLGVLGRLAHAVAVRRELAAIFDYRARAIAARFPVRPSPAEDAS